MQQAIAREGPTAVERVAQQFSGAWSVLKLMARNRIGFLGFLLMLFFVLLSLVGPRIVPLDTTTKVDQIYQTPSRAHPLGTDHQGRDIWSQIVHGGRDVLYVGFLASLVATAIAVSLGSLSAIVSGWFDGLMMGLTDIVLTIPQFPLLAVIAGLVRFDSLSMLALLLGFLSWPVLLRAVRSQVLSLKQRDYVEAARALDLGTRHIIFSEVLPNMMTYIAISFALGMTQAIYNQVALIYLGLVPLSGANWGVMINLAWVRGAIFYRDSLLYILSPIMAIALFQLAVVWMTRSLEQVFNPRLREGV